MPGGGQDDGIENMSTPYIYDSWGGYERSDPINDFTQLILAKWISIPSFCTINEELFLHTYFILPLGISSSFIYLSPIEDGKVDGSLTIRHIDESSQRRSISMNFGITSPTRPILISPM